MKDGIVTHTNCTTKDLFTSTKSLYSFQPLLTDEDSFRAISPWFAALNFVLGVYIVVANILVVLCYSGKIKQVVPLLYTFIASNDILTGSRTTFICRIKYHICCLISHFVPYFYMFQI